MSNFTPETFLNAFQARAACCRALLELSRLQGREIATDNYPELLELLNSKQALIEHLGRLSADQEPLRTEWPIARTRFSSVDRDRCETVLADTESLLATLLNEEKAASVQMQAQRDATQRELQSLAVGVQTQDAYNSRAPASSSRFDVNL